MLPLTSIKQHAFLTPVYISHAMKQIGWKKYSIRGRTEFSEQKRRRITAKQGDVPKEPNNDTSSHVCVSEELFHIKMLL